MNQRNTRNIAIVTSVWPSLDNPISGIFVAEHASALAESGHEVSIIVTQVNRASTLIGTKALGLSEIDIDLKRISLSQPPSRLGILSALWSLSVTSAILGQKLARCGTLSQADTVIVHGQMPLGFGRWIWPRPLLRKPTAIIIHGASPFLSRRDVSWLLRKINPISLRSVELVAPVGLTLLPYLRLLGIPTGKIKVLGNGTCIPRNTRDRVASRPHRILTVSNLHPEKDVARLVAALATLQELDWTLDIVGDGPERNRIKALARDFQDPSRIRIHGRLDRAATLSFFDRADIFCLPSRREAFGLVFLEALARGVPAIGCSGTGAAEVISDSETGLLVSQGQTQELSRSLEKLLTDDQLRCEMSAAAVESTKTSTWDQYNVSLLSEIDSRYHN